ncbi:TetR/AcrR family transcriptional regulator [Neobacillus sp. PS3-40]|uniref:TetR/AcrR family transcriptional regulator n=1 Tax=Neobacillus sp. PS3-40 TaxID=3070679 RepID=UPI0027DF31EC|nr:TetR/AcrR family transcriptional regulator [Neobacillus sp. PS3-40]WML43237.1 TetR/AcrR family transcriptional regulator [Neobacillus sp. PS3-40]
MSRNREFDEKVVLRKAMELFWKQGYEKTSMQDLVDYMGIHRRSIYDTFGDKRSLFLASLTYYETFVIETFTGIISNSTTVKKAVRDVFNYVIQSAELDVYPTGCLSVNAAVELSLLDQDIKHIVTKMFKDTEAMFEQMLEEGRKKGELNEELNPQITAQFLHNNLVGLRVMVKTNYSKEELESILDLMLKVLD